jgi:hypothetical protein
MPLSIPAPPPGVEGEVLDAVVEILENSCLPLPYVCRPHEIHLVQPQHLFAYNFLQFTDHLPPSVADETGWRWFVAEGPDSSPFAGADAMLNAEDGYDFAGLSAGSFLSGTLQAIAFATARANSEPTTYELRFLGMGWILVGAVWLEAGGDGDLYLPIEPVSQGLDPTHFYSPSELIGALT